MRKIEINLTEDERLTLEFRNFEYVGIRVNFNQFLSGMNEYSEEHYARIVNTLTEKYTLLQRCLLDILKAHGYKRVAVKAFDFYMVDNIVVING